MAFNFPAEKDDFTAENGVTYHWSENRWRTKAFRTSEGDAKPDTRLPYRLGTDKAARAGTAAIELVDAEDNYSNVKLVGLNGIKTESTISGINIDGSGLLTSEDANKTYLRDGFMAYKTCIFRLGGTNDDAIKLTMIEGGGTLWRLNNKEGKGKPIVYETANNCSHQFNTDKDGTIKKVFHIQNNYVDSYAFSRFLSGLAVKQEGTSIGGNNVFDVRPTHGTYNGRIEQPTDLVNKEYIDSCLPNAHGKWITEYNHGYQIRDAGVFDAIPNNEVAFLGDGDLATDSFAAIKKVLLCPTQVNNDFATRIGKKAGQRRTESKVIFRKEK